MPKGGRTEQAVDQFSGEVFTTRSLMRMLPGTSRAAVDKYLSRLVEAGSLRRLARGLYARAVHHPVLGDIYPGPEAIANALSRDESIGPVPSGSAALHALGLSEQVPNRLVFHTIGPNRSITFDGQTIEMKHVPPSRLRITNPKIATVIEALRELGKGRITDEIVAALRNALTPEERNLLVDSIPDAPVWMHPTLRKLTALR